MQSLTRSGLLWPAFVVIACTEGATLSDDDGMGSGGAGMGSSSGGAPSSGGSTSGGMTGTASGGRSTSGGATSGGTKSTGGSSSTGGTATGGSDNTIFTGAPSCHGPLGGGGGQGGTDGGTSSGGASTGGVSSGGASEHGGSAGTGASGGGGAGGDGGAGGAGAASFQAPVGGAAGSASAGATGTAGSGGAAVTAAFCDDFEDGDAGGWTPENGGFAITRDDSLTLESGPGPAMAIASDTEFSDQIVEARVKVLNFSSNSNSYRAGLIARYTGGSNYYSLSLAGNGALRILKGNSTVSGCNDYAANVVVGTWYTLRLEVTGPANSVKVSAFLDGKPAQSCTLTSNTVVTGSAGVFTYGSDTSALFDQVLVYAP